jgi:cell division protein FtsB
MASGSDGSGGILARQRIGMARARQRRMAELEAKRDALQEKIDELRDEIYYFKEGHCCPNKAIEHPCNILF